MSLRKKEGDAIIIPELDQAYLSQDAVKCYQFLDGISNGTVIQTRGLLLAVTAPLEDEQALMAQSIAAKREFGLVIAPGVHEVIEGGSNALDLDDVAGVIYKIKPDETEFLFTHMHWDINIHPLPSFGVIGIGDVGIWRFFRSRYPNIECRVAFNLGNSVRAISYLRDNQS